MTGPKRLGTHAIPELMPPIFFKHQQLVAEAVAMQSHNGDKSPEVVAAVRSIAARAADAYFEDFPALFQMMHASIETNAEVESLLLEAEADMAADPHRSDAMLDLVDRLRKAL